MTVFQHVSFCRFSDLRSLRLADVLHEVDYFKIHVRYSKTDQAGLGQTVFIGFCSQGSSHVDVFIFTPIR